ncbi:MAG: dipeptidase [Pseudomonadales bacterium]|nr:dipeptidase [Pseudomonadales bacterium]
MKYCFREAIQWIVIGITLIGLPAIAWSDDLDARVARVLKSTPLIDGHNDLPWQFQRRSRNQLSGLNLRSDLSQLAQPTDTDIPRLRRGQVGGLFWSVYVPIRGYDGEQGDVQAVIAQIDLVKRMVAKYDDTFELTLTPAATREAHQRGKIASMIGIEGGHAIQNSLATLRGLFDLGARYMTLTHSKGLSWADSATDDPRVGGLTPFGEQVVLEMNRLGMLVDLAHVSTETMKDALRITRSPVIFSHSSAWSVTNHDRNVPDDILRAVAANRGVVMVNYLTSYVSEPMRLYRMAYEAREAEIKASHPASQRDSELARWVSENPAPEVTLYDVADHIDHLRAVAGIQAIGLGADFDGMPPGPVGLEDVSTYPALFKELLIRGYSDQDIAKIAGENILRAWSEAEAIAQRLQQLEPPREDQPAPGSAGN